jgi:integration host factor subunit alpha
MSTTLTRADLSEIIHYDVGLSQIESRKMVDAILGHICSALSAGENVKISGFGVFILRDKAARVGRNPKTREAVPIEPRRVLTFRPSARFRERVAPHLS